MKTMKCCQLGGACDVEFKAETFKEMAEQSKQHAAEMFKAQDEAHLKVMGEMKEMMQIPGAMEAWFEKKRQEFEALPDS